MGSFGRNPPAEPNLGSFGLTSIRALNGAVGAHSEQANKLMSLRCKVPRSLVRAYFGELHRSFVHRGCITFHRIRRRCPDVNAITGTIPRWGIFGMQNGTGGRNSAMDARIGRGSLLGLSQSDLGKQRHAILPRGQLVEATPGYHNLSIGFMVNDGRPFSGRSRPG
jgi:hypothetical protein